MEASVAPLALSVSMQPGSKVDMLSKEGIRLFVWLADIHMCACVEYTVCISETHKQVDFTQLPPSAANWSWNCTNNHIMSIISASDDRGKFLPPVFTL